MERKEEYDRLLAALDNTPPALEYAVTRAKARAKKSQHRRRFFAVPVSSILVVLMSFVAMVNISTTFAMACGQIPVLRELASAVSFSPSLSAAVENNYVQPIDLEQSKDGITMRVDYVIVDQKQLNIFYTLQSQSYTQMTTTPSIAAPDGTPLEGYAITQSFARDDDDRLQQITVDFIDNDMPGSLVLTCKIQDMGSETMAAPVQVDLTRDDPGEDPDFVSAFTFTLDFDPSYTQVGEVISLDQSFVLDGQHLTATTVEIYPTHLRLNLADDENNTAWLKSLTFYLENEKGERFEAISNGISATGCPDSPFMASHRLESAFFSESRHLTLVFTGVVWLDKDMARVKIDLANGTADKLPEGVTLVESIRNGSSWALTFTGEERKENGSYQLFETKYYDEAGNDYAYNSWSTLNNFDEETKTDTETPDTFKTQFYLLDYPFDTVYLSPSFSRAVTLETPLEIKVK